MKKIISLLQAVVLLFALSSCNTNVFGINKNKSYTQTTTSKHALVQVDNAQLLTHEWLDISSQWDYYRNRFLNAYQFYNNGPVASSQLPAANGIVSIPHYWKDAQGTATYHLRIIGLKSNTTYATFLYDKFSTAGEVMCNGKYVYSEGFCSKDWTKTVCGRNMDIVYLRSDNSGVMDLVMRCSNKIYRTGGIYYHIKIAEQAYVENWFMKMFTLRLIFIGALVVIFIYQLALFFFNKYQMMNLYLALFALNATQRLLFASFSIATVLIPSIPYSLSLKLEVMPVYLCGMFYFLFALSYNKKPVLRPFPLICVSVAGLLFLTNVFLPLSLANYFVPAYEAYMLFCGVYGVFITLSKQSDGKRQLNLFDFTGLIALLVGTSHDVAVLYNMPVVAPDTEFVMYAFIIFVILQSMNTAWIQNRLSENIKRITYDTAQANIASYRFVPQQFLKIIDKHDICALKPKDHCTQKVSLINTDVRNFTTISEGLGGKEVFNLLNLYLGYIAPIIRYYNGFIEKVMGDGIIAVFTGTPDNAVLCALEMQEAMVLLRAYLKKEQLPEIEIGIGVHYGDVVLGTVGNEHRMSEVVVSPVVSEVMAVESYQKVCGMPVIVSEEVVKNIDEKKLFNMNEIGQKKETPCKGYNGRLYSVEKSVEF